MEARLRDYNDAINDCITALSDLYESTGDGAIYNAKDKSTLEKLKSDYEKYPYVGVPRQKETSSNDETQVEHNAPPLGLMPRHIHTKCRISEIRNAIERYFAAGKLIPVEWITEYNELIEKLPIEEKEFMYSLANQPE